MPRAVLGGHMDDIQKKIGLLFGNIRRVLIGKDDQIKLALSALFCQGHLLLEDVPGVGKTVLAKCIAKSVHGEFSRIQFTPDLLPSDITGVTIYNQKKGSFDLKKGPVFTNILLADEINRATPRTQSSLLESMEEHQATIDGKTHPLPEVFFVVATQNPVEQQGTFPLPEAQLDRFLLKISLGYPNREEEVSILENQMREHPIASLAPVIEILDLMSIQSVVAEIYVNASIKDYIVRIVEATRSHKDVHLGASPRGSLAVMRLAQAMSLFAAQDYVVPQYVKAVAKPALRHRLILSAEAAISGVSADQVIDDILGRVEVPREMES